MNAPDGTTQADRFSKALYDSLRRASGYVRTRNVDIGDHVRKGQLLAEIEAPELEQLLRVFGEHGEGYVRIALVENEQRIRQAARNIRRFLDTGLEKLHNVVPLATRR